MAISALRGDMPLAAGEGRPAPHANNAPKPKPVLLSAVTSQATLYPDDRILGLNHIVAKVIDPATRVELVQVPPEWQIDLSVKLREMAAKIFGGA